MNRLPYGAMFTCLKCGYYFEHRWKGGDPKDKEAHAATNCKKCNHLYVEKEKDHD